MVCPGWLELVVGYYYLGPAWVSGEVLGSMLDRFGYYGPSWTGWGIMVCPVPAKVSGGILWSVLDRLG